MFALIKFILTTFVLVACSSNAPTADNQKELLQDALEEISERPKLNEGEIDFKAMENSPPSIQWTGWNQGDQVSLNGKDFSFSFQLENLEENAILFVRLNDKLLGTYKSLKGEINIPLSLLPKGANTIRMHLETPLGEMYPFENCQKIITFFVDSAKPEAWSDKSPMIAIGNPVGNYVGRKSKIPFRYFTKNAQDLRIRYSLGKIQKILPAVMDDENPAFFLNLKPGVHILSAELIEKNSLAPIRGVGTKDKVTFTILP